MKNKKVLIIVLVVLIVLALAAIGGIFRNSIYES